MKKHLCLTGIVFLLAVISFAQQLDSAIDRITQFPNRLFANIAIEIETDIQPRLYDDFLFTGLNYSAVQNSIYVKFGFE